MKEELGIHIIDDRYGTQFWTVESNPDLTVKERFRRYIELARLMIELKYPGSNLDVVSLRNHIDQLIEKGNIK